MILSLWLLPSYNSSIQQSEKWSCYWSPCMGEGANSRAQSRPYTPYDSLNDLLHRNYMYGLRGGVFSETAQWSHSQLIYQYIYEAS